MKLPNKNHKDTIIIITMLIILCLGIWIIWTVADFVGTYYFELPHTYNIADINCGNFSLLVSQKVTKGIIELGEIITKSDNYFFVYHNQKTKKSMQLDNNFISETFLKSLNITYLDFEKQIPNSYNPPFILRISPKDFSEQDFYDISTCISQNSDFSGRYFKPFQVTYGSMEDFAEFICDNSTKLTVSSNYRNDSELYVAIQKESDSSSDWSLYGTIILNDNHVESYSSRDINTSELMKICKNKQGQNLLDLLVLNISLKNIP